MIFMSNKGKIKFTEMISCKHKHYSSRKRWAVFTLLHSTKQDPGKPPRAHHIEVSWKQGATLQVQGEMLKQEDFWGHAAPCCALEWARAGFLPDSLFISSPWVLGLLPLQ